MFNLPPKIIQFDTEYTAWEGSMEREWRGEGEFREIVQIGAVLVETAGFHELDSFSVLVRLVLNPQLSEYFTTITGIAQADIERDGRTYSEALAQFHEWACEYPLYSFGQDRNILQETCQLQQVEFPFNGSRFMNIRHLFASRGIAVHDYVSGTLTRAFGEEPAVRAHDALNDARVVAHALQLLKKQEYGS